MKKELGQKLGYILEEFMPNEAKISIQDIANITGNNPDEIKKQIDKILKKSE